MCQPPFMSDQTGKDDHGRMREAVHVDVDNNFMARLPA